MEKSATKKETFSKRRERRKRKKPINLDAYRKAGRIIVKQTSLLSHQKIVDRYKDILTNTWNVQTRQTIVRALNDISDIGGAITQAELGLIERNVEAALGQPLADAQASKIIRVDEGNWLNTRGAVEAELGVTLGWNLADKAALDLLGQNTFFWIGNHYDRFVQSGIRSTMNEYFTGGLNRRDVMLRLRRDFESQFGRSDSYWDLLADHTATKIREMSRLSNYAQAGVEVIRVKAVLDSKTTEICRSLHGTVISIEDLDKQFRRQLKATESGKPEKVKEAWPWWSDKQTTRRLNSSADVNANVARGNIGMPPYHARCRTRTVAEFKADAGDRVLSDQDRANGARTFEDKPKPRKKKTQAERASEVDWSKRNLGSVKTAAQASLWFQARHSGVIADFTGITNATAIQKVLRPTLKELDRQFVKFPEIAKEIAYVGTQRGKAWTAASKKFLRDIGVEPTKRNITRHKRQFGLGKSTYAHSYKYRDGNLGLIGLNKDWYNDLKRYQESIERSLKTGYHPKGTSFAAVAAHEFGHSIQNWIKVRFPTAMRKFDQDNGFASNVSAYAETKKTESWAEAYQSQKYGTRELKANPYLKAQRKLIEETTEVKL